MKRLGGVEAKQVCFPPVAGWGMIGGMERFLVASLPWLLMLVGMITLWDAHTLRAFDKRMEQQDAIAPPWLRQHMRPPPPKSGSQVWKTIHGIAEFIAGGTLLYFW